MSPIFFFLASLYTYANSKHFPEHPSWVKSILGTSSLNKMIAILCFCIGTFLEVRLFGWGAGMLTSLFWMGLVLSLLILFLPFSRRAFAALSLLTIVISLLKTIL